MPDLPRELGGITIVGNGRMGNLLAESFRAAGADVVGPLSRTQSVDQSSGVVLLCVNDDAIADVTDSIPSGPVVGHCAGAHGPEILGERGGFCLHPLMTVTADSSPAALQGAFAAIDGSDATLIELAAKLADALGMQSARVLPENRSAYHAAASIASNFLLTVEAAAETIASHAGVPRSALVPLVQATVANWAAEGARLALTGPIARGDEATVTKQRLAVADSHAELLPLFDALCLATRSLAAEAVPT